MSLVIEKNIANGGLTQANNPVSQAQEPFREKAFCIVGDEMKVKIEALGLSENDIVEISFENKNYEFLELIDIHFSQLQELRKILENKYIDEYKRFQENMFGDDFQKMIADETKRGLLVMLSYNSSLTKLFQSYEGKWQQIINKKYFRNFSHLINYSSDGEKYQFDWDLAVQFFELAEKIERERKGGEDRFDLFDELCDAYKNLYEVIKKPELFNDLLKLSIANGPKDIIFLLGNLKDLSNHEVEKIGTNYELFIKLGILAGKNNYQFFRFPRKLQLPENENEKKLIIAGWEKLGEDFFYIYENPFILEIAKNHPEKYIWLCENLKNLADLTGKNEAFYILCLEKIINFILKYPDSSKFLIKSAQILGKYSLNVMGTGIKFLEVLYTHFPENYEEILQKTLELGKDMKNGNDVLFMSSGLNFLAPYLEKDGEERFFEMAEKMINLTNEFTIDENIGVFYSQKEIPLTYGLGFIKVYLEYFPKKYDEILKKVMGLMQKTFSSSWEKFFLGISLFIKERFIKNNPGLLDNLLDFFEEIAEENKNTQLIFNLLETVFERKDKEAISNTLVWLLKNNRNTIIPFIKLLFIINDLSLNIDLSSILNGEINDEKCETLKKEVKEKLKTKIFFQNNKKNTTYDETLQEVFGERIDEKLKGFEKTPEKQRNKNLKKVNSKQKKDLKPYGIECFDDYDENHRTLVLYFRAENMDSFQFSLITHILQKYISSGYSKVFDKILVTSRYYGFYPKEIHELGNIPYQHEDFKMITNIFANTIHFTHGTVIENGCDYMGTTIPIIGIANWADADDEEKVRIPKNGNYIPLHLKYGKTKGRYTPEHFEKDKSGNFEDLFNEIIRAVKACEDRMIEDCK